MSIDSRLLVDAEIIFEDQEFCYILKKDIIPWLMLIPKKEVYTELYELPEQLQSSLLKRSGNISRVFIKSFNAKKVNVANLGNIVSQFHWHIIARYENDRAWPGPIWGTQTSNISDEEFHNRKEIILKNLN